MARSSREGADRRVLGSGGRARVRPGRLPAGPRRAGPPAAAGRPARRRSRRARPPSAARRARGGRARGGGRHRREGRQRPRAGLARRPADGRGGLRRLARRTPRRAREAGADLVLELPWGGKVRAQDAAVDATDAPLLAFSDANALWEPAALRALVAALEQDGVGYACGSVELPSTRADGTNQEGLYWRYEMAIRARESALASVTGGNGAIYAVRRAAYARVDPVMGHDLSFPFTLVRRGWRAVYAPAARATEKMVPTVEGEWRRKRRMMSHAWPIVLRGGLLDLRGLAPRTPGWSSRTAGCATRRPSCTSSCSPPRRRRPDAAPAAPARAALARRAPCSPPRRRRVPRGPPRPDRPLLRPDAGEHRRRAVGPPAPRHPRGLGAAGGHAVSRRAFDLVGGRGRARPRRPDPAGGGRRHPPRVARARRSSASGASGATASPSTCSSSARWSPAPRAWAAAWPSSRATRASPGSARCCAGPRSTSSRTSSTSCAARCRSSARGRRSRSRSSATPSASAAACRSSPGITGWAQVHGRTELPWADRIELDLFYVEHRSWRLDLEILRRTVVMVAGGRGLYRGDAPAWRD